MPIDALVSVSTLDATLEATCSFVELHTHVCVLVDKFTIVISIFAEILKYNVLLFLQVVVPYDEEQCPPGMDKSPPSQVSCVDLNLI
jgi:hypothetical protein